MYAVKGNRQYTITEAEKKTYAAKGFDIIEDGKIIEHGAGKTVPFAKYQAALDELAALQEAKPAKELKAAQEQIKALEAELAEVKSKLPKEE